MTSEALPILESLTVAPRAAYYMQYRWADYVELRCLAHTDKCFSRDGLAEAIGESADLNSDGDDDLSIWGNLDACDDGSDTSANPASMQDKSEAHSAETFRTLKSRSATFAEDWPFEIADNGSEIRLRKNLSDSNRLYIQLLLSASLRYCPKGRRATYTKNFEKIACKVFKELMPRGSEVHPFGAANTTRYSGQLFDRIEKLAKDVRGSLRTKRSDYSKNNTGDGGLDLVAWHSLGDDRDNIPIAFAQCGCTADNWHNKMLEASPTKISGWLIAGHPWATYYFMPLDLSKPGSASKLAWAEPQSISQVIVIDRLRVLRLVEASTLNICELLSQSEIQEVLDFKSS